MAGYFPDSHRALTPQTSHQRETWLPSLNTRSLTLETFANVPIKKAPGEAFLLLLTQEPRRGKTRLAHGAGSMLGQALDPKGKLGPWIGCAIFCLETGK